MSPSAFNGNPLNIWSQNVWSDQWLFILLAFPCTRLSLQLCKRWKLKQPHQSIFRPDIGPDVCEMTLSNKKIKRPTSALARWIGHVVMLHWWVRYHRIEQSFKNRNLHSRLFGHTCSPYRHTCGWQHLGVAWTSNRLNNCFQKCADAALHAPAHCLPPCALETTPAVSSGRVQIRVVTMLGNPSVMTSITRPSNCQKQLSH